MAMNTFTRFRIELGPKVTFDENTVFLMDGVENPSSSELFDTVNMIDVSSKSKVLVQNIELKVPTDASKLVEFKKDVASLAFFIKSDGTLVNDAFAYSIVDDNWIKFETPIITIAN